MFHVMFWHDGTWKLLWATFHDIDSAMCAVNEYRRGPDANMQFRIVQVVKDYDDSGRG